MSSYREQIAAEKRKKAEREQELLEQVSRHPLSPRQITDLRLKALTEAAISGPREEALFHLQGVLKAIEKERMEVDLAYAKLAEEKADAGSHRSSG